ncbi:F-box protein PP2-B10 [Linum grandiflorum]
MAPFNFRSDKHFVTSSDGTTLQVNELTKPLTNPSSIQKSYWKPIATINMSEDNDVNTYNGLLFFDGHGLIEGRKALITLARHLSLLHLMVNPAGYCFQDVSTLYGGQYSDFGIHYLRLNDLFSWPHHEVGLVSTNQWGRHELKYHHAPRRSTTGNKSARNAAGASKEKQYYEELMKKKDEELAKLQEKLEETNEARREEVEKLRKEKEAEMKKMSRMVNKKKVDDEAKDKRIEELEKWKEELEEKMEVKEEELQNAKKEKNEELRKLIVKKDNEIRILRSRKDDESQRSSGDPKTVMIGAKDLRISWGENPNHWKWRSDPDSRVAEVAELLNVWWFNITGKVDMGSSRMLMALPEKASYAAYFVFKMSSNAKGFGNQGVEVEVGVGGRNVSKGVVYLQDGISSGSRKRGDGWSEVKMGDFLTVGRGGDAPAKNEDYYVDMKLCNLMSTLKTGVIVHGIELRPN